jgi:hypothetical protein
MVVFRSVVGEDEHVRVKAMWISSTMLPSSNGLSLPSSSKMGGKSSQHSMAQTSYTFDHDSCNIQDHSLLNSLGPNLRR